MTKVEFPIVRTVVYNNSPVQRVINKGDEVNCYFCNHRFRVNTKTASVDDYDGMQMITCPNPECGRKIPVLYYFDRVIPEIKPKRKRKTEKKKLSTDFFAEIFS